MTVILKEEITIEVLETNLNEIVIAKYSSPEDKISVYLHKDAFKKAKTVFQGKQIMQEKGLWAVTEFGLQKILNGKNITQKDIFVDAHKSIRKEQLLFFSNNNGFVYRYGEEIPLNTPFSESLCAMMFNLGEELWNHLENHPWIDLEQETQFVPGNGTTWYLTIKLPDREFADLYRFAKDIDNPYFSKNRMLECLLHEFHGYKDLLGIHNLLKKPEEDFDEELEDDWEYGRM